jgi:dipeptidyl aminopeptidase/acylaminoacyl peptidase
MTSYDLLPELAEGLDRLVPSDDVVPRWRDVLERAGAGRRRRTRRTLRLAFSVAVLILVLAGVATATYVLLQRGSTTQPSPGALTITAGGYNAKWPVEIVEVRPNGRVVVVWRCPVRTGCGEPLGLDWSPDGRRVAFTIWALNIKSTYLGLNIIDVRAGHDVHPLLDGCEPSAVSWSPDGRTLAYDCAASSPKTSRIHLIASDGTNERVLATTGAGATSPTWAPDGTQIAFSRRGRIYIVHLAGGAPHLVARDGSRPDWSPDGRLIAYRSPSGVRLVTPAGRHVRTASGRLTIGPAGAPAWSPDGRRLAISVDGGSGLYVVDATGRNLRRLPITANVGSLDQPSWYPLTRRTQTRATIPTCGAKCVVP